MGSVFKVKRLKIDEDGSPIFMGEKPDVWIQTQVSG